MQEIHAQQMQLKALRLQVEKLVEDNRVEQMNAQWRHIKQEVQRRAVEAFVEEQGRNFECDQRAAVEQLAEKRRLEMFRKEIVEEERQKFLKEHAVRLLEFLPKGPKTRGTAGADADHRKMSASRSTTSGVDETRREAA